MSMNFLNIFKQILKEKVDLLGTKPEDFTKRVKDSAKKVESEHSDSVKKQVKTGMEHAAEFPKETKDKKIDSDYYEELDKMEGKLKKKSTKSFKDVVADIDKEKLEENMMAGGVGSVFGSGVTSTASQFSGDTYATGDARMVVPQSTTKKGKKKKKQPIMPIIRRTPVNEAMSRNAYIIVKDGNYLRAGYGEQNFAGFRLVGGYSPAQAAGNYNMKHKTRVDAVELTPSLKNKLIEIRDKRNAVPKNQNDVTTQRNLAAPAPIIAGSQLTLGI